MRSYSFQLMRRVKCILHLINSCYISFHIDVYLYHINHNIGFTPALLNIGSGRQQLSKSHRDGNRCLVKAPELTSYLFRILEDHLPSNICAENGQGR